MRSPHILQIIELGGAGGTRFAPDYPVACLVKGKCGVLREKRVQLD